MSFSFVLSAFGDEIAEDLQQQIQILRDVSIGYLELRGVWGKNAVCLSDDEVNHVRQMCASYSLHVSCVASSVGKSSLDAPIEFEASRLIRIFRIAQVLGTQRVRIFSFYPPTGSCLVRSEDDLERATARLAKLTDLATQEGIMLLLENDVNLVGDKPEQCRAILQAIDSPNLRFTWDPANFVQTQVTQPTRQGWSLLAPYIAHVHIKDAVLTDGSIRLPGEGDGEVRELLTLLRGNDYEGFLALEPHLVRADRSNGFSGANGMVAAATALRDLLAALK